MTDRSIFLDVFDAFDATDKIKMAPTVFIVEKHHEVLAVWAQLRRTFNDCPRLVSLDHHTDTSPPFRSYIKQNFGPNYGESEVLRRTWLAEIKHDDPMSISRAIARLNNDEHIVTALNSNILSTAMVIAHKAYDTNIEIYSQHNIICYGVDRKNPSQGLQKNDCDQVLESHFLKGGLKHFEEILKSAGQAPIAKIPYILDIDLDYFNTYAAINPKNQKTFLELAHNATAITIAREPDYVNTCALEQGLSSDRILSSLLALLDLHLTTHTHDAN